MVGGLLVIAIGGGGYYYYTIKQKANASAMIGLEKERVIMQDQLNRQMQEQEQKDQEARLKEDEERREEDKRQRVCKMQTVNDVRDMFLWMDGKIADEIARMLDRMTLDPAELATFISNTKKQAGGCS
jgi:uncharacterized protein HemX